MSMYQWMSKWVAIGIALGSIQIAAAQSNDDQTGAAAARGAALVAQDAELNALFRSAQQNISGEARADLQGSQRRWILARNELCALTVREATAADWPGNLANSKADCVIRVTQNRISALRQYRPIASMAGFADQDQLMPVSEFTFPMGYTSGKRYVEIEIQRELLARIGGNELHVGIDNVDGFYALSGNDKARMADDHEVIGLAVDLDRYLLYWRNATTRFSEDGQPLARGTKPYSPKIKGGNDLHVLLSRGHVRFNHGQRPFRYPMPAGYTAWFVPSEKDAPFNWILPPYERMSGLDRPKIAKGYWDWLLDRDSDQNPAQDRTGAACALNQNDKFWYLAGAAESDRIERRCSVPFGTVLVVPVIAMLLAFDEIGDCQKNDRLASLAPFTLQNTWLEINGTRFDRLQDYSASISTCPPLEVAGKLYSRQANWLGLWVPLRPLPRGEHAISFGGRFNAMNADRRVTYKISVQ